MGSCISLMLYNVGEERLGEAVPSYREGLIRRGGAGEGCVGRHAEGLHGAVPTLPQTDREVLQRLQHKV